jgi:hypothetical protein
MTFLRPLNAVVPMEGVRAFLLAFLYLRWIGVVRQPGRELLRSMGPQSENQIAGIPGAPHGPVNIH